MAQVNDLEVKSPSVSKNPSDVAPSKSTHVLNALPQPNSDTVKNARSSIESPSFAPAESLVAKENNAHASTSLTEPMHPTSTLSHTPSSIVSGDKFATSLAAKPVELTSPGMLSDSTGTPRSANIRIKPLLEPTNGPHALSKPASTSKPERTSNAPLVRTTTVPVKKTRVSKVITKPNPPKTCAVTAGCVTDVKMAKGAVNHNSLDLNNSVCKTLMRANNHSNINKTSETTFQRLAKPTVSPKASNLADKATIPSPTVKVGETKDTPTTTSQIIRQAWDSTFATAKTETSPIDKSTVLPTSEISGPKVPNLSTVPKPTVAAVNSSPSRNQHVASAPVKPLQQNTNDLKAPLTNPVHLKTPAPTASNIVRVVSHPRSSKAVSEPIAKAVTTPLKASSILPSATRSSSPNQKEFITTTPNVTSGLDQSRVISSATDPSAVPSNTSKPLPPAKKIIVKSIARKCPPATQSKPGVKIQGERPSVTPTAPAPGSVVVGRPPPVPVRSKPLPLKPSGVRKKCTPACYEKCRRICLQRRARAAAAAAAAGNTKPNSHDRPSAVANKTVSDKAGGASSSIPLSSITSNAGPPPPTSSVKTSRNEGPGSVARATPALSTGSTRLARDHAETNSRMVSTPGHRTYVKKVVLRDGIRKVVLVPVSKSAKRPANAVLEPLKTSSGSNTVTGSSLPSCATNRGVSDRPQPAVGNRVIKREVLPASQSTLKSVSPTLAEEKTTGALSKVFAKDTTTVPDGFRRVTKHSDSVPLLSQTQNTRLDPNQNATKTVEKVLLASQTGSETMVVKKEEPTVVVQPANARPNFNNSHLENSSVPNEYQLSDEWFSSKIYKSEATVVVETKSGEHQLRSTNIVKDESHLQGFIDEEPIPTILELSSERPHEDQPWQAEAQSLQHPPKEESRLLKQKRELDFLDNVVGGAERAVGAAPSGMITLTDVTAKTNSGPTETLGSSRRNDTVALSAKASGCGDRAVKGSSVAYSTRRLAPRPALNCEPLMVTNEADDDIGVEPSREMRSSISNTAQQGPSNAVVENAVPPVGYSSSSQNVPVASDPLTPTPKSSRRKRDKYAHIDVSKYLPAGRTVRDGEHVTIWNRREERKIAGNAAPLGRNLARYLNSNPHCEVYVNQDVGKLGIRSGHRGFLDLSGVGDGEHVSIWNRAEQRKIAGNAAPLKKNLENYLKKRPDCEVYTGQDVALKQKRLSSSKVSKSLDSRHVESDTSVNHTTGSDKIKERATTQQSIEDGRASSNQTADEGDRQGESSGVGNDPKVKVEDEEVDPIVKSIEEPNWPVLLDPMEHDDPRQAIYQNEFDAAAALVLNENESEDDQLFSPVFITGPLGADEPIEDLMANVDTFEMERFIIADENAGSASQVSRPLQEWFPPLGDLPLSSE